MGSPKETAATVTAEVLAVLRRNPEGLSALALADNVAERGFALYEVQRAIRRAIDDGVVVVGDHLELRRPPEYA